VAVPGTMAACCCSLIMSCADRWLMLDFRARFCTQQSMIPAVSCAVGGWQVGLVAFVLFLVETFVMGLGSLEEMLPAIEFGHMVREDGRQGGLEGGV
jgi:hypothetical protein